MPAPIAIPVLGKALAFAKGLTGLGGAVKGGAGALKALSKGQAARKFAGDKLGSLIGKSKAKQLSIPGLDVRPGIKDISKMQPGEMIDHLKNLKTKDVLNSGLNMSDDAGLLDRIKRAGTLEGFKKNVGGFGPAELATQFGYDALSGLMVGATTEGDLVDKAIAGSGVALGGGLGGLTARGVLGPKSAGGIMAAEFGGMMLGDAVGYGMADNLIRVKNGGMTPAEQKYAKQDEEYRSQLLQELKQQYGLG